MENSKMRLIITGGAGFIGSSLIRHILSNTKHEVINIDKLTYSGNLESLAGAELHKNYHFEQVDICDSEEIKRIFNQFKPTAVMHLAAESHVDRSIDSPYIFLKTNIIGTFNLLNNARSYFESSPKPIQKNFRFHHISTDEVYGDLNNDGSFFTEESSYDPSSPYSASKASSDHLVRAWQRTYGLPVVVTNCSNNYGPFHFPEKLIPHIILSALDGRNLPIYGNGLQIRDWLYVEDHARALLKVLEEGKINQTYNIGGNNEKTNLEVVEHICELLEELAPNKPANVKNYSDLITFVKDRPGHDKRYAIDSTKINKELNWYPNETFESGLRKTVKWYLQNKKWWNNVLSGNYKLERRGEKE